MIIITHINHSILLKSKYSKEVRFPISDGIVLKNEFLPIPTKKQCNVKMLSNLKQYLSIIHKLLTQVQIFERGYLAKLRWQRPRHFIITFFTILIISKKIIQNSFREHRRRLAIKENLPIIRTSKSSRFPSSVGIFDDNLLFSGQYKLYSEKLSNQ